MTFLDILPIVGGISLFLFGMTLMGEGLEKLAGAKLERLLERLTSTTFKGVLLGTAVTAIIQSSAATTVMVVGFVNAGIMNLSQGVGVIMGANIGTTATAWLLTLADITNTGLFFTLIKPANLCYILICIGGILYFGKAGRKKDTGSVLFGLGVLFLGMRMLEQGLSPLREMPAFTNLFTSFKNPLLGILVGALVTAAIQSSSASVGLLQALAASGLVSFSTAVPIIMGQNIGTCVTVLIASIGANKNAKRAALTHLYFNLIGTTVFTIVIYSVQALIGIPFWNNLISRTDISIFHSFFNIINTMWLLPLNGVLIKLVNMTIKSDEAGDVQSRLGLLEPRFLSTPAIALDQSLKVLNQMATIAHRNVDRSVALLEHYDSKEAEILQEEERFLDKADTKLSNYIVQITSEQLTAEETDRAADMLKIINDFERIGDHAINIAEVADYNVKNGVAFSGYAKSELQVITEAVREIMDTTFASYFNVDEALAFTVEPLEEVIDDMQERLKNQHIERLQAGVCSVQAGISFLEILSNFERISDHCSNIALVVLRVKWRGTGYFDGHKYQRQIHKAEDPHYLELTEAFRKKYLDQIGPAIPPQHAMDIFDDSIPE